VAAAAGDAKILHVAGFDRAKIRGSFLIAVYAEIDGEKRLIGHEAVLSHRHITGCANCQGHLQVSADFRVPDKHAANGALRIEVRTHDGPLGGAPQPVNKAGVTALKAVAPAITVELR
jgi:tyrosinase